MPIEFRQGPNELIIEVPALYETSCYNVELQQNLLVCFQSKIKASKHEPFSSWRSGSRRS